MTALTISNAVLWLVVLLLAAAVLALARQLGVLHERIAPAGALMMRRGLAVGEAVPVLEVADLEGQAHQVGSARADGRSTLLLFVSPGCPVCKSLLPAVKSSRKDERSWVDVILASDGDSAEQRAFVAAHGLEGIPYIVSAALGLALVENGWRVMFARTTDLVQRLQVARRELALENTIAKLDRYDLLILDDIAYVTKDQAETSVLFELIAARYERRSMLITANQPFGEWGKIFPDQAMTLAAIDRLVHHSTILEMNVESYRRREALDRKRGRGRPPTHATINKTEKAED